VPPPTPLLKRIGYGTGVSVYHMDRSPYNHALRSPWALKTVNRQHSGRSDFQERIETEAKILKQLKHPNIVGFRGYSMTEDGRKVLAMEECSESLGDLKEQMCESGGTRFSQQQIVSVIAGVAKGLQYLHDDKGLLHGDIKSYNILIKGNFEEVKLCDFGVSLELKSAKVEDYVGTGAWAAPEALDEGPLTDKADIFSLGLVIWEMLTLKAPHMDIDDSLASEEAFDMSTCEMHFGESPALLEGLPGDYALVEELYIWCTQQNHQLRPHARNILTKLSEHGIALSALPTHIVL